MNKELEWWDKWNTQSRTDTFTTEEEGGRTGLMALEEVRRLKLKTPSILEIGCGTGWLAEKLSSMGPYLGIDISPAAVTVAKGRVPEVEFVAADLHSWEYAGKHDVVVMVDTIAYFRDQDMAVSRTWKFLNTNGWLVLTTVNPFVYSRISSIGPPQPGQTRKWLTRSDLVSLLHRNGFEIVKCYTVFPAGDRGILRLLNSRKIAKALFGGKFPSWYTRLREACGLGRFRLVVAKKQG